MCSCCLLVFRLQVAGCYSCVRMLQRDAVVIPCCFFRRIWSPLLSGLLCGCFYTSAADVLDDFWFSRQWCQLLCPKKLSGSRSHRDGDWKGALSRMTARVGCSNRVGPGHNEMGMAAPGRAGSRAPGLTSKPSFLRLMVQPSCTCPSHTHRLPPM